MSLKRTIYKPGDIVLVDSSEFAASPLATGREIECKVLYVIGAGDPYVSRLDSHDSKYVYRVRLKTLA